VYPLSLNALRLACNQTTNRDPVVDYDEPTVRSALDRLGRRGWTRLASGPGSRAAKFRQLVDEAIGLSGAELSLLALLMLRGAQTPGELKARSERLHRFDSLDEIEGALSDLADRELVARLGRRPGQKEDRYAQLLGESGAAEEAGTAIHPGAADDRETDRLAALEAAIREVHEDISELRGELAALRRTHATDSPA
jgi:uncharacterized protein YceH (UPF0502 family)